MPKGTYCNYVDLSIGQVYKGNMKGWIFFLGEPQNRLWHKLPLSTVPRSTCLIKSVSQGGDCSLNLLH